MLPDDQGVRMKFTVYTAKGCRWCTKIIQALANSGLELDVVSIRHNSDAITFLQERNLTTVPQVFAHDSQGVYYVGGHDDTMKYLYKKGLITKRST